MTVLHVRIAPERLEEIEAQLQAALKACASVSLSPAEVAVLLDAYRRQEATRDVVDAISWCHLGSSQARRPNRDEAFGETERLGLLKHHPTWHATERGIGALILAGLLEGEPAPETTGVTLLWARDTSYPWPAFVAAYASGLVDCWPSAFDRLRKEAEQFYRGFVPGASFFTTHAELVRPE